MKIGIYVGVIPPPVFIENLIIGLAENKNKVVVYGKPVIRNYKFSNQNIIQRRFPLTKIGVMLQTILNLIRLFIKNPYLCLSIIKMIKLYSNSFGHFFYRSCRVLPPFIDKLEIFHIQWAKTLVNYPEFIKKLNCPVLFTP